MRACTGWGARLRSASIVCFLSSGMASAATIRVPSEFPTIFQALDAAADGDTVLVAPGSYSDYDVRNVTGLGTWSAMGFFKGPVTLLSEQGAAATELRAGPASTSSARTLVSDAVTSGEVVVDGFTFVSTLTSRSGVYTQLSAKMTVRNCVFDGLDPYGIKMFRSDMEVVDCDFRACRFAITSNGGGQLWVRGTNFRGCFDSPVFLFDSAGAVADYAEFESCLFQDNTSTGDGGAVVIARYPLGGVLRNCQFISNTAALSGGAVILSAPITSFNGYTIEGCTFIDNEALGLGGALNVAARSATVTGNSFHNNTAQHAQGLGAVHFTSTGSAALSNNVVVGSGGVAVSNQAGPVLSDCNIFWNNAAGIGSNYTPSSTDREADPLFCDPLTGVLDVQPDSPCLPLNSNGCGLIGAAGQGCGIVSVERKSWGAIKSAYREEKTP